MDWWFYQPFWVPGHYPYPIRQSEKLLTWVDGPCQWHTRLLIHYPGHGRSENTPAEKPVGRGIALDAENVAHSSGNGRSRR